MNLLPALPDQGIDSNMGNIRMSRNSATFGHVHIRSTTFECVIVHSDIRTFGYIRIHSPRNLPKFENYILHGPASRCQPLNPDFDVFDWWRKNQHKFANLAKKARQFLASPASTGGVGRLFSKAGRMYSDLRNATQEGTMMYSLFASIN